MSCGLQATGVLCCEYTCSQLEFSLVGFMSCERDLTVVFPGGPWSASSPLRPSIYTLCLDNRTGVEKTTLTHTHTPVSPFTLCPGLVTTRVSQYQKGKTNLDLLKQETVSGISWAMCKSAPTSGPITMPAPHHSVFYRPDALPATQPTVSKH